MALVPWTVFAIAALVDALRDWRFSAQQPPGEEDLRLYLALWLLLPIIFFSFSQSKVAGYILPAIPAGTICWRDSIFRREKEDTRPAIWMVLLHSLVCAAMLSAALIVPFKLLKLPLTRNVIVVAAALAIVTILMLWFTLMQNQGYRILRFRDAHPAGHCGSLTLLGTAPILNLLQSERPVETSLEQTEIGRIAGHRRLRCFRRACSTGLPSTAIIRSRATRTMKSPPATTLW